MSLIAAGALRVRGVAHEEQQLCDDGEKHAAVVADIDVGGDVAAHFGVAAAVGGEHGERQ